ncbi:AEC family transporter [Acinetobacter sp. CAAS 2-6]|uniref:AEC family transporter n=1 Tax=Acinetobacter sp. CAAS 2-6 TaxID=3016358 RepID=UPI002DD624AC|nr:permease [Acinetobacter sp. CAAS 2-6]
MAMLVALVAFCCGWCLAAQDWSNRLKPILASLLARCLIPVVIIYNMVFYQPGSLGLMLFSFGSALVLYALFFYFSHDRLRALCFSYVNLAWLGFPFAIALFGPEISAAMVALYIGGSIFGNIWAVTAVCSSPQPWTAIAVKVLRSPPIIALAVAGLARLSGLHQVQDPHLLQWVYLFCKWAMSLAGMCVLGMWLRHTKVAWDDVLQSSQVAGIKLLCGAVLCGVTYLAFAALRPFIGVMFLLFCLPPAANIVALETHYQGTGRSAAYIAAGTMVSCVIVLLYAVVLHILR